MPTPCRRWTRSLRQVAYACHRRVPTSPSVSGQGPSGPASYSLRLDAAAGTWVTPWESSYESRPCAFGLVSDRLSDYRHVHQSLHWSGNLDNRRTRLPRPARRSGVRRGGLGAPVHRWHRAAQEWGANPPRSSAVPAAPVAPHRSVERELSPRSLENRRGASRRGFKSHTHCADRGSLTSNIGQGPSSCTLPVDCRESP